MKRPFTVLTRDEYHEENHSSWVAPSLCDLVEGHINYVTLYIRMDDTGEKHAWSVDYMREEDGLHRCRFYDTYPCDDCNKQADEDGNFDGSPGHMEEFLVSYDCILLGHQ